MRRILVIRIDFLGDMVCSTSLIHSLKQRWPMAEIHVLANKYNAPILDRNPDVQAVHHYVYSKKFEKNCRPGRLNAFIDRFKLICKLRSLNFDLLVIPNGGMNKSSIQFAKFLNVGDCRWHTEESGFDDRIESHIKERVMQHEVLSGYELVPELGSVDINDLKLYIYPDSALQKEWTETLGEKRNPRVGLFISNKSDARRWSWSKWHDLSLEYGAAADFVIFHAPGDRPASEQLKGINARCVSTHTVPDLIAAMSQLDVIVSADSAPVHIGAALQIPVVALFESRPEKYLRWYPLGVKHILIHEGPRVEDIRVEPVKEAIGLLLKDMR
ncbi:glycosyltransferase family 9 protein [Brenneria izadpanahii]|uniref:Glycosyltransferase family 9 protein n=1 Tax=Brenneria izadpanahii TaxID=2722756 RepID=A0ABX7UM84_9GAMM|nr:glycosyltransferase family 9 protein [Brenneria izadpanahii]QTF06644.1 glycosyltransferase family 9 protein [Brenneria izadpanahii]